MKEEDREELAQIWVGVSRASWPQKPRFFSGLKISVSLRDQTVPISLFLLSIHCQPLTTLHFISSPSNAHLFPECHLSPTCTSLKHPSFQSRLTSWAVDPSNCLLNIFIDMSWRHCFRCWKSPASPLLFYFLSLFGHHHPSKYSSLGHFYELSWLPHMPNRSLHPRDNSIITQCIDL